MLDLHPSLAERVRAADPALVAVVAPAGFGKSTFLRELLGGAGPVCDCRGSAGALGLARRLLPALADEAPERSPALARVETLLGGDGDAAGGLAATLAAWRAPVAPGLFAFENAEDALADPGAREFLARLLAERPEERTVVVCSREPLRFQLSRFASPHRVVTVRAEDLAFDEPRIAAAFAGSGASAETLSRVAALTRGWPIAVLLLARFAREGRLEALLDRLDDVAYEELHGYLAERVLDAAEPAVVDALVACAALDPASERDLRLVLGEAGCAAFLRFAGWSPLVARDPDGWFRAHPLLGPALAAARPGRAEALLAPAAAAYEAAGEDERAAEIHLARGDAGAAATALGRVEAVTDGAPGMAYARVLAALDRDTLRDHPRLWTVAALLRRLAVDPRALLAEAEAVWRRLPPDAPAPVRVALSGFRVLLMSDGGEHERALALVEGFRTQIAAPDVPATRMHAWLLYLRGLLCERLGRFADAERDLTAAWPFVEGNDVVATSALLALAEAEAAFGAWLAGDEAALLQHAFALEAAVERDGVAGLAFFAATLHGRSRDPGPADHPFWIACGRLVAGDAERAREAAAHARSPLLQLLAALALAERDVTKRAALRAEASAIAAALDAPEHLVEAFLRRLRAAAETTAPAGIAVEIVTGRVVRDRAALELPEREHALLTALAIRPEPIARERLTDLLWPDLNEAAARNAFHVCLHRLKARLGDERAVARSRDGYRLGDGVRVDLREIERGVAALRGVERPDDAQLARLRTLHEALRGSRPARIEAWDWFEPTDRRLRELRCEVAHALASAALAAGRTAEALALAHETIAYDPCDEPAREVAIRAYLANGDRAAALRHFRQYRDTLVAELQCEPSAALAALVGADA